MRRRSGGSPEAAEAEAEGEAETEAATATATATDGQNGSKAVSLAALPICAPAWAGYRDRVLSHVFFSPFPPFAGESGGTAAACTSCLLRHAPLHLSVASGVIWMRLTW